MALIRGRKVSGTLGERAPGLVLVGRLTPARKWATVLMPIQLASVSKRVLRQKTAQLKIINYHEVGTCFHRNNKCNSETKVELDNSASINTAVFV